ncbi:unnamed protein product [Polarella glacialis]|uniref:Uncharacterized protein n=2 Tax=Polarella glacialis TaxID=89957 RepID=A0A813ERQ0_POLGL|nr:unnamed protein product [Polarella glacialis]
MTSKPDERTAQLCMLIIGIGYLFPIAAIWAAFDYWKVLFPSNNVEFLVTSVYQVGSVVTVLALARSETFELRPRILAGFGGQFASLAAILCFRWLPVPEQALYGTLLAVVLVCSVCTGYLDSALLALCSQYSTSMQQYLQIGIGFGTLVSVVYRDLTKLLMPQNIADATSVYFGIALLTVLICVSAYRLLMSLPVSRGICGSDLSERLIEPSGSSPVNSPLPYACGGIVEIQQHVCLEDSLEANSGAKSASISDKAATSFAVVWRLTWRNHLVIIMNFFLTTLCYPGLITSIPNRQMVQLSTAHWFQTLLLTVFTCADIPGRFLTHKRFGLHHGNVGWTVVIRAAVFPLMLFCASSADASDILAFAVVALFGGLNGYCASLSLIVINEIPTLSTEQRKTCGRISACSVNGGLALGSLAASAISLMMGLTS